MLSEAVGFVGKLVAHDHLGLFDTPPNRQEIRLGVVAVGLQFVALLVISPWQHIRLAEIGAFVPVIDAMMCVGELIIATKLYMQAAIFRSRALTILASGYVFGALLLIPHALTFPGAFTANGLLGAGVNTTIWIAMLVGLAYPSTVILYAVLKSAEIAVQPRPERPTAPIFKGLAVAIGLAVLATIMATSGHDLLPPLYLNHSVGIPSSLTILDAVATVITIAAMALLLRLDKSVLDLWLLVALCGWFFQLVLIFSVHARFTLGWYGLFGLQLASSFIIMVALIAETNRLYAQLAVWAVARDREREIRMMSMDAVAAAISHEVGQPLTAVALSASAGLNYLTRAQPDADMAIQALRDNLDAGHRAFDVLKSVRATFTKGTGSKSGFDVNDLVRETTSLLANEFAAHRILLMLTLDEALPPIVANRVQIQRVLVNLLTNAIEAFGAPRRRGGRVEIRSMIRDSESVLIEISDTGVGIAPEKMADIFDPFFTTKSTGTGLGLSLSRNIVEEHAGRLWASPGENHGTTFHLQLPLCLPQAMSA